MRTLLASVILTLTFAVAIIPASAQAPPIAFEDANNNGTWDAGTDKDVTQALVTQREFITPHSVVITAALKPLDPKFKQTGMDGGAYIRAGKSITVLGSILAPYYGGNVILWADDKVTVGDKVALVGRNRVTIAALGAITIGNGASMTSSGGSANQGAIGISGHGPVVIGTGFIAKGLQDVAIDGRGGSIVMGAGANLASTKSPVRITATGDIRIDGATLKGATIDVTSFTGAIAFRNGVATVPKSGLIGVYSYTKTVDVTGTRFVGPVAVWPAAARAAKK